MVGDAREHLAQVSFGIDVVELGGADQAVNCGGTFAAGVGACEQVALPGPAGTSLGHRESANVMVCLTHLFGGVVTLEKLPECKQLRGFDGPARAPT